MLVVALLALPVMMATAPEPVRAAPARAAAPSTAKPVCQQTGKWKAVDRAEPRSVHPLGAEPPASQILSVLRTVDGCTRPVTVRKDAETPRR